MKIYDITLPITETIPVWENQERVQMHFTSHQNRGDTATVTMMTLSAHTGTHPDAPLHFIPGGGGIETLDLNVLCGRGTLVEIMTDAHEHIGVKHLEALNLPSDARCLLIRTQNSQLWKAGRTTFKKDYVALAVDGARWMVDRGIKLAVRIASEMQSKNRVIIHAYKN